MKSRPTYRDRLLEAQKANDHYALLAGKPKLDYGTMIKPPPVKRALRKPSATSEPSEHDLQKAVIQWWGQAHHVYKLPRFALVAIPNAQILMGSARHPERVMSYLHAEGFRDGVLDLFLFSASWTYHGLAIEIKRRLGVVSQEQRDWIAYLLKMNYQAAICRSSEEAIEVIKWYLRE